MKLVDPPERSWLDRMSTDSCRFKREQRAGKMAGNVRDMIDALDPDEYIAHIAEMDLSRQEIEEMCAALERHWRWVRYNDERAIKYLRSLQPKRIWGVR